eukprot:TRINITY_DN461_c0_g1_i3.p1 TRINITY_DN461_c0_g1~~TRINITY_DN461_c0_g1_i3.p1  ORF type:complete len:240 (-),score=72.51 TRINITY_DN461_c0_g1_i3:39-758(-)
MPGTRWQECDKLPYICSYLLDPRLAMEGVSLNNFDLAQILEIVFKRLFGHESSSLVVEFAAYMKLEKERKQFFGRPHLFWEFASEGMQDLSQLGQCLISLSPQGATLERVFSASGIFHNARRNRLSHEKAEKMVRVKMDLLQRSPRRPRHAVKLRRLNDVSQDDVEEDVGSATEGDLSDEDGKLTNNADDILEDEGDDDSATPERIEMLERANSSLEDVTLEMLYNDAFNYRELFDRFE